MKKIFNNAFSNDDSGWFICDARDWPYKNKTNKEVFVAKPLPPTGEMGIGVNDDPEVKAYLDEVDEVRKQLHEELVKVAVDLKLHICDFDGKEYGEGDKIEEVVIDDNEEGKKLSDALISMGWEKHFIPIGP